MFPRSSLQLSDVLTPQWIKWPGDLDLLTLKVVSETPVTWATFVPILVFIGLSVLDLGPMYATDVRQTFYSIIALCPRLLGVVHNNQKHRLSAGILYDLCKQKLVLWMKVTLLWEYKCTVWRHLLIITHQSAHCMHCMQSAIYFLPFLSTHLVLVLCDVSSDLFHRLVAVFQVTSSSPYWFLHIVPNTSKVWDKDVSKCPDFLWWRWIRLPFCTYLKHCLVGLSLKFPIVNTVAKF